MAGKNEDRRQVMIPQDLWDQTNILAKADTTSASQILRVALREYIGRRKAEAIKARKKRAAAGR